jgi:hypothetical protein
VTKADEYRERVRALDYTGVMALWGQVQKRDTPDWPPGLALEYLLLRAFQLEGAQVTWPYVVPPVGLVVEQIDGAVHTDGLWCLVEAKDEQEEIAVEPIAKLRNQLLRRPAGVVGLFFSTSDFTESAETLSCYVAPQIVLLWNGLDVRYALEKRKLREGLLAKYRHTVEYADPTARLEVLFR